MTKDNQFKNKKCDKTARRSANFERYCSQTCRSRQKLRQNYGYGHTYGQNCTCTKYRFDLILENRSGTETTTSSTVTSRESERAHQVRAPRGRLFEINNVVKFSNINITNTLLCYAKDSHIFQQKITLYLII